MTGDGLRRRGLAALPVVLAFALAAAVPLLNDDSVLTQQLTRVALFAMALLGLNVAMGYAGLQSLATGAVFGIGALGAARLDDRHVARLRLPGGRLSGTVVPDESVLRLLGSIAGGALVATVLGLVILLPALRLGRSATTMVSLYMAVSFPILVNVEGLAGLTGGGTGFKNVRQLVLAQDTGGDGAARVHQEYWIVLGAALVAFLLLRRLLRSHWGRAFIAVRDDEVGAQAMGVDPVRTKVLALLLFSLLAGTAGALYAHSTGGNADVATISGNSFDLSLAIFLFAALVVGGVGSLWGPVLGAAVLGLFQQFSDARNFDPVWRDTIFGGLLVVSVVTATGGVAGNLRRVGGRLRPTHRAAAPALSPAKPPARPSLPAVPAHPGLTCENVSARFGGTVALSEVSLHAGAGRVHALVGANGSGKTTLLNVISGLVTPTGGRVLRGDHDLRGRPVRRSRGGLGRTFQTPRVAIRLSALENVLMGGFARYRTGWAGLYVTPWRRAREDASLRDEAGRLLGAVGLASRADVEADQLSHGERRLLEVARALLGEPLILLLDEPAAGLAPEELSELAALVRAARDSGCAVVLVEHNLGFVRSVGDDCTVLERGRTIARGTPAEVLSEPAVVASFVGAAA